MPRIIENPQEIILEHALRILEEQGYDALNMRNIARSCGIATGTIYNYFPTKQDLLLQMMSSYWEQQYQTIDTVINSDIGTFIKLEKVFTMMEGFVQYFKETWINWRQDKESFDVEKGMQDHSVFLERLVDQVEAILLAGGTGAAPRLQYQVTANELARFIIQNFYSMCHMRLLSYREFEVILHSLLQ